MIALMIDAEVRIWGERVGAIFWDSAKGYALFEYEPSFLKLGYDLAPLTMPSKEASRGNVIFDFRNLNFDTYHGLPGLLSESLPDRYGTLLIDRWLAEQGREAGAITPLERLCYTGDRGMGALEYEPAIEGFKSKDKAIELNRLVRLASEILAKKDQLYVNLNGLDRQGLMEIVQVGTSAGGARAKAVIAYNQSTGEVRSGQIDNLPGYDYWIIKLDGVTNRQLGDPEGYGRIEYAYYGMVKDCGIDMTECCLKTENDRAHFMTKRFDRVEGGKVHMQSLCGIAHFDYNQPGAYSYEQAFEVLRRLNLPYRDQEELFRRMCFNVVARNQDDHTKNISFLMDRAGVWKLSPAYDMIYSYNPTSKWTGHHQMSVNGERENITRSDIIQMARKMNIKKSANILDQTVEVVSKWREYAKKAEVDLSTIRAIEKTMLLSI